MRTLWRAASRYHFASLQDRHPVVAARHNGYAVALIDALSEIATEEEGMSILKESIKDMRRQILSVQDAIETRALKLVKELEEKGIKLDLGLSPHGTLYMLRTFKNEQMFGQANITNFPPAGYFPGWKEKVGPVVVVMTPEQEYEIRGTYDTRGVTWVRAWKGEQIP